MTFNPAARRGRRGCVPTEARAFTLIECVLCVLCLTVSVLAMTLATGSAKSSLSYSDDRFRSIQLGESLLEEIAASPYTGGGDDRADWDLDRYHLFEEEPGSILDVTGRHYPPEDQVYRRRSTVTVASYDIAELGITLSGKSVAVIVLTPEGTELILERFIPEPALP